MALRSKFVWTVIVLQLLFIVIFAVFLKYGSDLDETDPKNNKSVADGGQQRIDSLNRDYPMFQDVNAMIFVGIGLLYAFLRRYCYSGIGINFLLCAICLQWGMICQGWWKMRDGKVDITLASLYKGEFASASAVIALGAVFGKLGWLQLVVFSIIEVLIYTIMNNCRERYLQVADVGESVVLHLFAAVYGCSATYVLDKGAKVQNNPNEAPSYNSNLFCILGTLLLWAFWPSFNAIGDEGASQHRSVVNSYLALIGSGITCFATSALFNADNKITMSHIQNGALAGAVGVSSTANLMIQPFGALAIGAFSGCMCVAGFKYLTPFLAKLGIHDVCGINSLHGLPGLLSGILGVCATIFANEETYGYSLYKFYPAMAPLPNTTALTDLQSNASILIEQGLGRTAESQALYQFIYVIVEILVGILTGLLTGAILRMEILDPLKLSGYNFSN